LGAGHDIGSQAILANLVQNVMVVVGGSLNLSLQTVWSGLSFPTTFFHLTCPVLLHPPLAGPREKKKIATGPVLEHMGLASLCIPNRVHFINLISCSVYGRGSHAIRSSSPSATSLIIHHPHHHHHHLLNLRTPNMASCVIGPPFFFFSDISNSHSIVGYKV
jgi:hypothetical protein